MKPQLMFAFILLLPQSGPSSSTRFFNQDSGFLLCSCPRYSLFPAVWVGLMVFVKHLQQEVKMGLAFGQGRSVFLNQSTPLSARSLTTHFTEFLTSLLSFWPAWNPLIPSTYMDQLRESIWKCHQSKQCSRLQRNKIFQFLLSGRFEGDSNGCMR